MIRTPHLHQAARTAFFSATYRRTGVVRINGVWIVKVLP